MRSVVHPARVVMVLVLCAATQGALAQSPAGTAFTYQGRLTDAGGPANGTFDFRFTLYDAATAGNVVAGPVSTNGVAVAQGLFTAPLDFGPAAFPGQARWMQIEVRPTGGGGFTTLAPRQELTPAPYALFSSRTDPANLTGLNASNLTSGTVPGGRLSGTYAQALSLPNAANAISGTFTGNGLALTSLNASNLASGTVPSAALSGVYANALSLSNPANTFTGNGAGLTNLNAQAKYARTVVVGPVGTPAQNGAALLAALAGITTASAGSPWLLKVEPGTYDVGTTSFVMKPFVDVEGSGEGVTRITSQGSGSNTVGTVHAVTGSELRFLTVENTGGAAFAKALFVDNAAPRVSHVTVVGSGGSTESQGFFAQNGASPTVTDLTARANATGSANSFAVLNITGATSVFSDLQATASGGSFARAVATYAGATPTLRNVVAIATGATTENLGIATYDSSPTLENVVGIATGAAFNNIGCLNLGSTASPSVRLATCRGVGATGTNYGTLNNLGASPTIADLTASAFGGTFSRGVENNGAGPGLSLSRVRSAATGGSTDTVGLRNVNSSPRIVGLEVFAEGGGTSAVYGIQNESGSLNLSHVTVTAAGSTTDNVFGVISSGTAPAIVLVHAAVTASSATAQTVRGVVVLSGTTTTLSQVAISASGGTSFAVGVQGGPDGTTALTDVTASAAGLPGSIVYAISNFGGSFNLTGVTAVGAGAGLARVGLANTSSGRTVTVDRSTLSGGTNSILNDNTSTVTVALSQLAGPVANSGGAITTCLMSYSGSYAALNAACQ